MKSFFEQGYIDEVKAGNELVGLVSEYVRLKPSGKNFLGLCPFHREKTPSFHIHAERQVYRCFGCHEAGNAISFVMAMERLGFVETIQFLAKRAGIPEPNEILPQNSLVANAVSKELKERIYSANVEAAKFYRAKLMSAEGEKALKYFESRGVTSKVIGNFGLGYAPGEWDALKASLTELGFEEKVLVSAGLLSEGATGTYDRFRNRVIFPIIDVAGKVVAFGGRTLDDSMPKYLNTSETPVFSKSKQLYGLYRIAKTHQTVDIILAEGYMDVLAMYSYGFENAVASLGTSLTKDQAKAIKRYAKQVYIAFDGDSAGQKATSRAIEVLEEAEIVPKIAVFPTGMDPDDVLNKMGNSSFKEILNAGISTNAFKLKSLAGNFDLTTSNGKTEYAQSSIVWLGKIEDLIERNVHVKTLSTQTGISIGLINQEIERRRGRADIGSAADKNIAFGALKRERANTGSSQSRKIDRSIKAERTLVSVMVQNEQMAGLIHKRLLELHFEDDVSKSVLEIAGELLAEGRKVNPANVLDYVENKDFANIMVEIFTSDTDQGEIEKLVLDCVRVIKGRMEEQARKLKLEELLRLEKEGDINLEKYNKLLSSIDESNRKIKLKVQRDVGNK